VLGEVFVLIWLAGPFLLATVLAFAIGKGWLRTYMVLGVGVILAFGFVVAVYLGSPPDYQHSEGAGDGEMFLGRWWEPGWIFFVAVIGYLCWIVGVGVGAFGRVVTRPRSGDVEPER
jgi:hypothetical protein